jgi:hemerythrin-like metal-binding protein
MEKINLYNFIKNFKYLNFFKKQIIYVLNPIKHFKEEETILGALGYPYLNNHKQLHDELLIRAGQLEEAYMKKEIKLSAFFSFLLDEVIIGHMLDADTKFFSYVEKCHETSNDRDSSSN